MFTQEEDHNVNDLELQKQVVFLCRNPTLAKCGGEAQHLEKLEVESLPRLPNVQSSTARSSHWDVLGVIGKVLKRRYRK